MLGPKRFSDIRADLPGISANTLTQRLEGLEKVGLLVRRRLPPPVSVQVYELTDWGYEAEPIVQVLGRWAARSPDHDPTLPLSPVSLMLSFRTMFDVERARGLTMRIGFRLGAETFMLSLADGRIENRRSAIEGADVEISGTATAVAAAVYGGVPIEALEQEGAVKVEGDRALFGKFATLFPLPAKAERPSAV